MLDALEIAEIRGHGLLHSADLIELGVTSRLIRRALGEGVLVRVHRGVYALPKPNESLKPSELHRLQVRATIGLAGPDSVVSHLSAAAMHGLPLIGTWPKRVHVSRVGSLGGSSSPGIVSHRARDIPEITMIDDVAVTTLTRTVVDVASTCSFVIAVAMIDHALRVGGLTKEAVLAECDRVGLEFGKRKVFDAVEFSDERSGSPGESLSRVHAHLLGFAAPDLQVEVTTVRGKFDVDFGWLTARRFGEFDGIVKYTRAAYLKGRTVEQVVIAEKEREDSIRAKTGHTFVRWLWKDALNPAVFDRILREAEVPRSRGRG